jgi:hypothetical protein
MKPIRHRADRRALAHGPAHGDRQQLRVQHEEQVLAARALSSAQARAAADGAVERGSSSAAPRNLPDAWAADGQPHAWHEGEAAIAVVAVDESARSI